MVRFLEMNGLLPVQCGIDGLIDLAHAPLADEGGHVIVGDTGADG